MATRPSRQIAFVERHPPYFTALDAAVAELRGALGDVDVFALIDDEGQWEAACATVDPSVTAANWVQTRLLPAGEYEERTIGDVPGERLVARDDGRPPFLIARTEAPATEGQYEPGGETFGISTRLGDAAGLRRIGVNVDVIRPGERSTRFHWHSEEEECFLVLEGEGILQVGADSFRVGPGDFFAKPEGPECAHQFVNDGDADLRILTIGEHRGDTVEYPPPPWEPGRPLPKAR